MKPIKRTVSLLQPFMLAGLGLTTLSASAWQLATNLNLRLEATVKEGYDSNVYLQNQTPNLTLVPNAVQPFKDTFFSTITPGLFLDYKPCEEFNFAASYAPAISFYYSTPSENNIANRILGNLSGQLAGATWELNNNLNLITGQNEGLYYGGTPYVGGNAPAMGGIPARDRRDATVYRGLYRATWTLGKFFVRPVGTAYVHDFHTVQKDNRAGQPDFGYENYVDRNEFGGGLDVGFEVVKNLRAFILYRYGSEGEGHHGGESLPLRHGHNRPGGGFEGQPFSWLKLAIALGDDIHRSTSVTAPGFERNYSKLWSDTTITFLPTKQDSIVFRFTRNTQPAFSSPSVYDDTAYDLLGRHRFNDHWSVGAGMRWYNGDWFYPVLRNDWLYTASASLAYSYSAHFTAELAYSYDWTDCNYPPLDTSGREYTRNLVSLGLKYAF
ncbi:MAG: hypothetical protein U1F83_08720 [Verrucomicrobiota bacterium]